jgi:DNA mismatch repair protein MutL
MGQIQLLSDVLASQVAAGEVVERPASVIKELLENAIDAGARRITVEFQRGGTRLIRVTDDGRGMDHSDALLCLERHATSKIRTSADLSSISTLGFRGEALPSIASVSRFRLSTCQKTGREEEIGTSVEVIGGKIITVKECGGAPGTRIEVADLFFNVPARRKFLRGEQTEAAHLLQQIEILAVAHPEIAFTCLRDEREVLRLAATSDLAVRLRDLYGEEFLRKLVLVPPMETHGIRVRGWIARPGEGRPDRTRQLLFVNGRMIRSPVLSLPLREACDGLLAKGLHPPAVLFFELDPSAVDCNVHPAKQEVRFRDPGLLRFAALQAARSAWENASPADNATRLHKPAPLQPALHEPLSPATPASGFERQPTKPWHSPSARIQESPPSLSSTSAPPASASAFGFQLSALSDSSPRYLGILDGRYLLFEDQQSLLLLEIRAARERIFHERFLARLGSSSGELDSQRLLLPEILNMSAGELAWIDAHQSLLHAAGLAVESFGSGSLKVDAVPADASSLPVEEVVNRLVDDLKSAAESPSPGLQLDRSTREALASAVSRLAAAGARLPPGEEAAQMLLRELLACNLPYATPRGRPTMTQLSPGELQRRFTT